MPAGPPRPLPARENLAGRPLDWPPDWTPGGAAGSGGSGGSGGPVPVAVATAHPSSVLRSRQREVDRAQLVDDLGVARTLLDQG
ncbi:hypothetical protein [Intrasporangium calvum]|uniref:Uncharacterized protein n=1 Tax=Intrasporangium calvum (strain ATCC 23552 / DSM 43043 / JCM 3097 / NBRC 12989 / NCIMB 10167 / NRRL B-3866 / 7 KIP) TaxID=710696 RepID=E6S8N7_INTC7|nr:hypothetical protein [Intrasporangium calvum]ADU47006.1 hypothetical protein Intca_0458 [Intrasporangium calvum DSM 43043]AXG12274.1 hypothetical protein DN585_01425 [Intrasporangium calvum]